MNDFEELVGKCEAYIVKLFNQLPTRWKRVFEAAIRFNYLENFPKMEKVESSNVDRIGYDSSNKIAYILFLNRSMYMYFNVTEAEFQNLKNADSVGSYFSREFRKKYESKKCARVGMMGF